jgi:2-polyprenyl-3-methyl-5-hydroxy-6-metoxy-1,4-benzoquinol methylase
LKAGFHRNLHARARTDRFRQSVLSGRIPGETRGSIERGGGGKDQDGKRGAALRKAQYYPGVFEVNDLQAAKSIILTDEGPGADTDTRWALETPYVTSLVAQHLGLAPGMLLLDYGCGIGRLARPLIEQFGCHVIGVDISASMRVLAPTYVEDERFSIVSPAQFDHLVGKGLRVDAAMSVWVLQHCVEPRQDAARIRRGLRPDGKAFVLNMLKRAVPALETVESAYQFHWVSDEQDVPAILREGFDVEAEGQVDPDAAPNMADAGSVWMRLARGPDEDGAGG